VRSPWLALLIAGCAFDSAPLEGGTGADAGGPDASPVIADAATPDGGGGCQSIPLLGNRDFESTTDIEAGHVIDPWVESSQIVYKNGEASGFVAQAGQYFAWFGGINDLTETLHQDFDVPANTDHLVLTGYRKIISNENNAAADTLTFYFTTDADAGAFAQVIAGFNATETSAEYVQFTVNPVPSPSHAGQRIRLSLKSINDGSQPTSFLIDTLSLVAETCP